MPVIGCFLLVLLPLLGLFIGGAINGKAGCEWGAAIGFGLAVILCAGGVHAFVTAARRSRR
jgi:tRNA U34 5-carboxymethylaminomethyl modifying enzyme MnmG/GidA